MLAFGTAPVNACPVYHVIPVAEYTPVPARAALPATQVHPDRPSTKRTRLLASTTGPPSRASTASPRCTKKPPDSGLRVQENALCYYLTRAVAPPIQVADQGEGVVTTPPPSPWLSTRRCSPELLSQPHMHTQACHQLSSYWPLPGPTTGFNRVTPTYEKTSRYGTVSAKNALCCYLTRAAAPPIQVADQGEGVVTTPPPSPWLITRRCSPELQ
jgi:hypothetical protein